MRKPQDELTARTPFGTAAQTSISGLYEQMISNLEGTASGDNIEALHDMRVASRRLRAALRVFKAALPCRNLRNVIDRVGTITRALGSVRDHDVFIDYLENRNLDSDIIWLIDMEKADRQKARVEMLNALHNLPSGSLESDIVLMLSKSGMTGSRSNNHMAAQAARLVTPRLNDLMGLSYAIYNLELITEIHQMRIAAKKLRYTMEAFIPCFGQPLTGMISELKLLQEQLGMIHDCDVWVDKLKTYRKHLNSLPERTASLNELIRDREECRIDAYNKAYNQWQTMIQSDFSLRLRDLIDYPNNNPIHITGGQKLVEETKNEAAEIEVVEEPAKKPVRRRTPAKKTVEAAVEPDAATLIQEPAEKPVRKRTPAKKIVQAAAEPETATPTEEQAYTAPAIVESAIETPAMEETAPAGEPQHPGIEHLKELVKDAASHLSDTKGMTDKMSKQFKKLEGEMEKLPGRLRKISIKEAAKAEKYLFRLREKVAEIPKSGWTKKGIDKVSEEVKSLRKKLPTGKK